MSTVSTVMERLNAFVSDTSGVSRDALVEYLATKLGAERMNRIDISEWYGDVMWDAINEDTRDWLRAEVDLVNCPVNDGDQIEFVVQAPRMSGLHVGDRARLIWANGTYSCLRNPESDTDGKWFFERSDFRLLPSGEWPDPPPWMAGNLYIDIIARAGGVSRGYETDCHCPRCNVIRGGVDALMAYIRSGNGIEFTEPTAKDFFGALLRAARARVVERLFGDTRGPATEPTPEPVPAPEPEPDVTALKARIEELERIAEERRILLESDQVSLRSMRSQLSNAHQDAETISEVLVAEANDRGWCSEYDMIVNRINERLRILQLAPREKEVEYTVSGEITIRFSYSASTMVPGNLVDDDLIDHIREEFDNNVSISELRYADLDWYDAEVDSDSMDISVAD